MITPIPLRLVTVAYPLAAVTVERLALAGRAFYGNACYCNERS